MSIIKSEEIKRSWRRYHEDNNCPGDYNQTLDDYNSYHAGVKDAETILTAQHDKEMGELMEWLGIERAESHDTLIQLFRNRNK